MPRLVAKAGHGADDRHRIVARCDRSLTNERSILILSNGKCADSSATNSRCRNRPSRCARRARASSMQHRQRRLGVLQQHRFGDLQLEPVRREAGGASACITVATRFGFLNCTGERLTATLDASRPAGRSAQASPQHPFAERHDQAGFLGQRNEIGRRDHAALGWFQRTSASKPTTTSLARSTDRLVMDLELVAPQRRAQVELEQRAAPVRGRPSRARRSDRCRGRPPWRGRARGRRSSAARRGSCRRSGASAMPMLTPRRSGGRRSRKARKDLDHAAARARRPPPARSRCRTGRSRTRRRRAAPPCRARVTHAPSRRRPL